MLLSLVFLISLVPTVSAVSAVPTPDEIKKQITTTYTKALKEAGRASFDGYCADYVNRQLKILGINTRYVGGNGNDEYDNYKNLNYSSGGYKVHAYGASKYTLTQAIKLIANQYPCVTNVLAGFQKTSTVAGQKYGHTHMIHAIIDGYVYFTESMSIRLNGVSYPEGSALVATIDQYCAKYDTSYFQFEGFIWFEDEELTSVLEGTDYVPPAPIVMTPGTYYVHESAGLWLREGPSTATEKLALIGYNNEVHITEIDGDWGRTYYNGKAGWVFHEYVTYKDVLPPVYAETVASGEVTSTYFYPTIADALAAYKSGEYVINLMESLALTKDVVLGDGITLDVGEFSVDMSKGDVIFDGGKVVSAASIPAFDADPFVSCSTADGGYCYTSDLAISVSADAPLENGDVRLRFTASGKGLSAVSGVKLDFIITNADGSTETVSATVKNDSATFTTDALSAKKIADAVSVKARAYAKSGSKTYERFSDSVTCSAKDCLGKDYGCSSKLDRYIKGVLNYGSASQKYFGYKANSLSNSVLPESQRKPSISAYDVIRAERAPHVVVTSTAHVNSVQLVIDDSVSLRFGVSEKPKSAELKLLVWSHSEYEALAKKAKNAGKTVSDYLVADNCNKSIKLSGSDFTFSDISPEKYADTYYFRLCQTENGKVSYDYVVAYSVSEYCAIKLSDGVNEGIDELCLAIADYSAAAREYFGYTVNKG